MKYAAEMGSGAMIYIPRVVHALKKLIGVVGFITDIHRQHGYRISLL
jgi:hypothetical protein